MSYNKWIILTIFQLKITYNIELICLHRHEKNPSYGVEDKLN